MVLATPRRHIEDRCAVPEVDVLRRVGQVVQVLSEPAHGTRGVNESGSAEVVMGST